ncbi:MAG: GNAT family N-acetyltransferase [Pseudomonadota bacterium]
MSDSSPLEMRELTQADVDLLCDLNHQLQVDEGSAPMTIPQLRDRLQQWLAEDSDAMGFYRNDRLLGYALWQRPYIDTANRPCVYLRQLFVQRDCRRLGYGQTIFQLLQDRVWPAGVNILLQVMVSNASGRQFWQSLGVEEVGINCVLPGKQP